jgi:type 1 glutamine amidotransferase
MAPSLSADEHYVVQNIPVPKNVVLEVSGLDYSADGTLYICTRRGDVWTVKEGRWKHFAWGLHESMGLCLGKKKGQVFVSQRPEITELVDTDGDGVADQYNTLTDGFSSVHSFHQYTYGLVRDKEGNLCGTLSCTGLTNAQGNPTSSHGFSGEPYRMWSFKVTPDGKFKPWSSGLRTANGIGMNLAGDLFSADNQGDWVPTSMLHHLTEGAFHGNAKALKWDKTFKYRDNPLKAPLEVLDKLRKMPAVHFPHGELANSPGAPICDTTGGKFGPFAGQLFIGDVVQPNLIRIALEKVNGQYQGACFPFIKGRPLKGGICRLAFSPEGELIVGRVGEGNWARGAPGQGLHKIAYSGKTPFEVHSIELVKDGFVLHFTKAIDPTVSGKKEPYKLTNYHYKYSGAYGSPKTGVKLIAVNGVQISDDHKSVFLKLDHLDARKVYEFKLSGVRDQDGKGLRNTMAYYTLNELSESQFDAAASDTVGNKGLSAEEKIEAAIPTKAHAEPRKPRKILVFSRSLGFVHKSIPHGKTALRLLGKKTGAYAATVTDDPVVFRERAALAEYDAIVFNNTCGNVVPDALGRRNLLDFVKKGGGFVGIHCAAHVTDWPEYVKMIGGFSISHPWNQEVHVKVEERSHPLVQPFSFPSFSHMDEIYVFRDFSRERSRVLLSLDKAKNNMRVAGSPGKDADYPLSWVHRYGKGRVFYCEFGHYPAVFWNRKVLSHYLAGLQYVVGDLEADDTPRADGKPPANAIVLFDGKDTSAWMQHKGMRIPTDAEVKKAPPCHFKIVDGALEVTSPGHLVTKQRFNDYRLHADVWWPNEDRVNSGIWTQFRYGLEIRGRGEKSAKYKLGAIYGLYPPAKDASQPARTWQTLDITFSNARFDKQGKKTEKARMTVLLNGVTIQDNVEIPSRCPTLVEPEGPSPGPIVLENHGNPVRFRNIWIVPK